MFTAIEGTDSEHPVRRPRRWVHGDHRQRRPPRLAAGRVGRPGRVPSGAHRRQQHRRPIMVFDVSAPELGAREVAPLDEASGGRSPRSAVRRSRSCSSWAPPPRQRGVRRRRRGPGRAGGVPDLRRDLSNRDPAVSPTGGTVTWAKCSPDGTGCDVYVAVREADGSWGTPLQLTDSTGEDILPTPTGPSSPTRRTPAATTTSGSRTSTGRTNGSWSCPTRRAASRPTRTSPAARSSSSARYPARRTPTSTSTGSPRASCSW